MKKILVLFSLICLIGSVMAQDVIVKKNGAQISAQIIKSNNSEIVYKLKDSPQLHKIQKKEVSELKYKVEGMTSYTRGSQKLKYISVYTGDTDSFRKQTQDDYSQEKQHENVRFNPYVAEGCFVVSVMAILFFW